MIEAIAILLICQLAGETLALGLNLPLPGPVLGLIFLFIGLVITGRLGRISTETVNASGIGMTGGTLLQHLSILFVPAGVGVIDHLDVLRTYGVALITALVVSTILSLAVTVLVFTGVKHLLNRGGKT